MSLLRVTKPAKTRVLRKEDARIRQKWYFEVLVVWWGITWVSRKGRQWREIISILE